MHPSALNSNASKLLRSPMAHSEISDPPFASKQGAQTVQASYHLYINIMHCRERDKTNVRPDLGDDSNMGTR